MKLQKEYVRLSATTELLRPSHTSAMHVPEEPTDVNVLHSMFESIRSAGECDVLQ